MHKIIYKLAIGAYLIPGIVFAQAIKVPQPTNIGIANKTLGELVAKVIEYAIMLSGLAFVLLLILGGLQYLTSAGSSEGAQKANRTMLNAIIGLGIVVASYAIARYVVVGLLKINNVF